MDIQDISIVAEKHFFAKKYTDVKLDNIANELNIKKPTLYYYFSNKKDLFVQTLKFSINNYMEALKLIIQTNDLIEFIDWYILFPSKSKNLFAISMQKGVCTDRKIGTIIFNAKNILNTTLYDYLYKFSDNKIKIYLFLNILEKLAQDNCIDGYCLKYDIEEIRTEIKNILN